jgi:hypothetical protein
VFGAASRGAVVCVFVDKAACSELDCLRNEMLAIVSTPTRDHELFNTLGINELRKEHIN